MTRNDYIVKEDDTLLTALGVINKNSARTVFVCDNGRLVASVSDGDIRRALLNDVKLEAPVKTIANPKPLFVTLDNADEAEKVMMDENINAIPVLDSEGKIVDVKTWTGGKKAYKPVTIPVVIMAGGKGTRLKPYTDILPKPLIPIGDVTITERIINRFYDNGCRDFRMIVNYKKEFIKAYFSDVRDENDRYSLKFTDETEFLGTGGGVALLKNELSDTFFMTNCDILVDVDYSDIYNTHKQNGNIVTIVCAQKDVTIPYGTIVSGEDGKVSEIKEKPTFHMQTNTGLYVIEPELFSRIPENTKIDMTDILSDCIKQGDRVGVYLINDSDWMDMGQMDELERMRNRIEGARK